MSTERGSGCECKIAEAKAREEGPEEEAEEEEEGGTEEAEEEDTEGMGMRKKHAAALNGDVA